MNTRKLEAKLIDIGVMSEDDKAVIKSFNDSLYVTIISGLDKHVTYTWMRGKLTFADGHAYIDDIEKLKKLEVEKFE